MSPDETDIVGRRRSVKMAEPVVFDSGVHGQLGLTTLDGGDTGPVPFVFLAATTNV
jgi:hypothetical protein